MNDFRDPGFGGTSTEAYDAISLSEAGRRVRRAVWWMLASVGLGIINGVVGFAIGAVMGPSSGPTMTAYTIAAGAVGAVVTLIIALQWWRATAPIEGVHYDRDAPRTRNGVRVSSIAFVVLGIAGIFVGTGAQQNQGFTPGSAPSFSQLFPPTLIAFMALAFVVSAVYYTCLARHMKWVSGLLPPDQRVPFADVCAWLVPLLCTVGILACGMGPLAGTILVFVVCFMVSARAMRAPGVAPLDEADEYAGFAS